jgi:hypothetical protein
LADGILARAALVVCLLAFEGVVEAVLVQGRLALGLALLLRPHGLHLGGGRGRAGGGEDQGGE